MGKNHLVSIIIPVYNRQHTIIKTLESVKEQLHRPLEIIIIDDGSNDESNEIIKKWKNENEAIGLQVRLLSQPNCGAPSARNNGLENASGNYIQFLDSDDLLTPNKISFQLAQMLKTDAEVAVCDFEYRNGKNEILKQVENQKNPLKQMAKGGSISVMTPLIKISLIRKGIVWDRSLKQNQDIDFNLKILFLSKSTIKTKGFWCYYIMHGSDQISSKYSSRIPPLSRRLKNIIFFLIKNWREIPSENKIYAAKIIRSLSFSTVRFWTLSYPKRIFVNLGFLKSPE